MDLVRPSPDLPTSDPGFDLPCSAWPADGVAVAACLAVHGVGDYRMAFARPGPALAAMGIATYAYDQRGFGETREAGQWVGRERLVADLQRGVTWLRERHPGLPLFVLGESMGAAVALLALAKGDVAITGLVLSAPALLPGGPGLPLRLLVGVALRLFPGLRIRGFAGRPATDDPAVLDGLRRDPLTGRGTPVRMIAGIGRLLQQASVLPAGGLPPTLILHGDRDPIVPRRRVDALLAAWPGMAPPPMLKTYPDGWHLLLRDRQSSRVLTDIADWIRALSGCAPACPGSASPMPRADRNSTS